MDRGGMKRKSPGHHPGLAHHIRAAMGRQPIIVFLSSPGFSSSLDDRTLGETFARRAHSCLWAKVFPHAAP